MNRIDRLFGIMTMLQASSHVTAEKISRKYNISTRTVYRDVKALCEQGIPVSFDQGRGYFLVDGYFLPPVSFSTEEANAMLLMESVVSGFADLSILDHYRSALNKVKAVLSPSQVRKTEQLQESIHFQVPECARPNFSYLSHLQEAITSQRILKISYVNKSGEASERQVEAIGLVFYAFSWHLIAWCHLRHEYRDFKIFRIRSVEKTSNPFIVKHTMTMQKYLEALPVEY